MTTYYFGPESKVYNNDPMLDWFSIWHIRDRCDYEYLTLGNFSLPSVLSMLDVPVNDEDLCMGWKAGETDPWIDFSPKPLQNEDGNIIYELKFNCKPVF